MCPEDHEADGGSSKISLIEWKQIFPNLGHVRNKQARLDGIYPDCQNLHLCAHGWYSTFSMLQKLYQF